MAISILSKMLVALVAVNQLGFVEAMHKIKSPAKKKKTEGSCSCLKEWTLCQKVEGVGCGTAVVGVFMLGLRTELNFESDKCADKWLLWPGVFLVVAGLIVACCACCTICSDNSEENTSEDIKHCCEFLIDKL